jgi:hypothetical protein
MANKPAARILTSMGQIDVAETAAWSLVRGKQG